MAPDKQTFQLIIDSLEQVKTEMRENHDEILKLEMRIGTQLGTCNLQSINRLNELAKINVDKINGVQEIVDKKISKSEETINSTMKWFLGFAFGVIVLLGGFIGWTAKEHVKLSQETTVFKNDFGNSLLMAPEDHSDIIGFDALRNKYNPVRGATIQSTKNKK